MMYIRKVFVLMLLMVCSIGAVWAYDGYEYVDGVRWYYEKSNDGTYAIVTQNSSDRYKGDIVIPTELGGLPVKEIGSYAFAYCGELISVKIPDCVWFIGKYAFSMCSGLTSVEIPDGVVYISYYAFADCTALRGIAIPSSVVRDSWNSASWFSGCTNLQEITVAADNPKFSSCDGMLYDKDGTSLLRCSPGRSGVVEVPSCVTNIGEYAFSGCRFIPSVSLPQGLREVGRDAFASCSKLVEVTLPTSVSVVGSCVFAYCRSLKTVSLSPNIAKIGVMMFQDCSSLQSIVIPEGVTNIEWSAFESCVSLTEVVIPASVIEIGEDVFGSTAKNGSGKCSAIRSVTIPGSFKLASLFPSVASITNVVIAEGSTSIVEGAFEGCDSLVRLTIPASVTNLTGRSLRALGDNVEIRISPDSKCLRNVDGVIYSADLSEIFYCPANRVGITLPNQLRVISDAAFQGCQNLESIALPDSVEIIGENAFDGCSKLTSIKIPDSVVKIWDDAFRGCYNVSNVDLGAMRWIESAPPHVYETVENNWVSLGGEVFRPRRANSPLIISVDMPEKGTIDFRWRNYATDTYSQLAVYLDDVQKKSICGVSSYESRYEHRYEWVQVTLDLPKGHHVLKWICNSSLYYDDAEVDLSLINASSQYHTMSELFPASYSQMQDISMHGELSFVPTSFFAGCSSLTSLDLPKGIRCVDDSAFSDCRSLSHVSGLSDGLTNIGSRAFYNCQSLTNVTLSASLLGVGYDAFGECSNIDHVTVCGDAVFSRTVEKCYETSGTGWTHLSNHVYEVSDNMTLGLRVPIRTTIHPMGFIDPSTTNWSGYFQMGVGVDKYASVWNCGVTNWVQFLWQMQPGDNTVAIVFDPYRVHFSDIRAHPRYYVDWADVEETVMPQGLANLFWSSRERIKSIDLPAGVKSFPRGAFAGLTALERISPSNRVDSLTECMFGDCRGLGELTIGPSVTNIPTDAFYNCHGLTNIVFLCSPPTVNPDSVVVAKDCVASIPWGVTGWGDDGTLWAGKVRVYHLPIPDGGPYSYDDGEVVWNFHVSNGSVVIDGAERGSNFGGRARVPAMISNTPVATIADESFLQCDWLKEIVLPETIATIGARAFNGCSALTNVVFRGVRPEIGSEAFGNGHADCTISVFAYTDDWHESDAMWSGHAFVRVPAEEGGPYTECVNGVAWTFAVTNGVAMLGNGDSAALPTNTSGVVSVPSYLGGRELQFINKNAFADCASVTELIIPTNVTQMILPVFCGMTQLTRLTVPFLGNQRDVEGGWTYVPGYLNSGSWMYETVEGHEKEEYFGTYKLSDMFFDGKFPDGLAYLEVTADTRLGTEAVDCPSLVEVVLGKSIQELGSGVLTPAHKLESLTLPFVGWNRANVRSYQYYDTLYGKGNTSYTSVGYLSSLLGSPERYALRKLTVTDADKLDGINLLGDMYPCLEEVVLCPPLGSIAAGSLSSSTSLTRINIPESVTNIGSEAFWRTSLVTNEMSIVDGCLLKCNVKDGGTLRIPEGVRLIARDAFKGAAVNEIVLPKSFQWMSVCDDGYNDGYGCFCEPDSLQTILVASDSPYFKSVDGMLLSADGRTLIRCPAKRGNVVIPESVRRIAAYAFYNCDDLTELAIPDGVEEIGGFAFYGCESLRYVSLPSITIKLDVDQHGNGPFSGCPNVQIGKIVATGDVPLKELLPGAYDKVSEFSFAPDTKRIVAGFFNGCGNVLGPLEIPSSVTNIGSGAFDGCQKVSTLTVASGNRDYLSSQNSIYTADGKRLLISAPAIEGTSVLDGCESIEQYAFRRRYNLKYIKLPNSLCTIGSEAFSYCSKLEGVRLPESLSEIGSYAFYQSGLRYIVVPNNVNKLNSGTFSGSLLESVVVGDGVTYVGYLCFENCRQLRSVCFGKNLTGMDDDAFGYNGNPYKLRQVMYKGPEPTIDGDELYGSQWNSNTSTVSYVGNAAPKWSVDIPGTWQQRPIQYADVVAFDSGECTVVTGDLCQALSEGVDVAYPKVNAPVGWQFVGWSERDASDVFHAQCQIISYEIRYQNDHGLASNMVCRYTCEDEFVFAPLTAPAGWTFLGWAPTKIEKGSTGDVTVTAQWERWVVDGCYGVQWKTNAVEGDGRASWLPGRVYQLPPCTETPPEGRHFAGWLGSNGKRYDDRMLVFDAVPVGEVLVLTPIWK